MELNKTETTLIEAVANEDQLQVLDDLQLALVGGGIGETAL